MKITIEAEPKEIAALVEEVQGRQRTDCLIKAIEKMGFTQEVIRSKCGEKTVEINDMRSAREAMGEYKNHMRKVAHHQHEAYVSMVGILSALIGDEQ